MKRKYNQLREDMNSQQSWATLSWDILKNLSSKKGIENGNQKETDLKKLQKMFLYLFWTGEKEDGDYCKGTYKDQQSSDLAILYTIIKYGDKDTIIKILKGKFNTDSFNGKWIDALRWLHHSPITLFVVDESDDGDSDILRGETPQKYLDKYAIIVAPRNENAFFRGSRETKKSINFNNIATKNYIDTINDTRLSILKNEFSASQFNKIMQIVEGFQKMDFNKFYKTMIFKIKNQINTDDNSYKALNCFLKLWFDEDLILAWSMEEYQKLYDLIRSFNTKKQRFEN